MPSNYRPIYSILVLVFVVAASLMGISPAQAQLSEDALMLLPADIIGLVVFTSLDDVEEHLLVPLREVVDPNDAEEMTLEELLPDDFEALSDVIDYSRPLAMAFSLGGQYGGPEPIAMVVLPVLPDTDAETMALVSGYPSAQVMGDYVALSEDPTYAVAGVVPALAENLPKGQMAVRVDLETIFAIMRPMLDGMLTSMEEANQSGEEAPGAPSMPEPTIQAIRGLMDSARIVEFAVDESDGELEFLMGLDIFAGSAFDMGRQPPLSDALALAAHLPDYGEMISVYAMDLSLLYENMPFLHEPSMMQLIEELAEPENEAAVAWWTVADELSRPFERASAATFRVYEESFEYVQVAKLGDAQDHLQKIDAHLASLPEARMGFVLELEASETRGDMSYRRYRWDFDPLQILDMLADDEETPDVDDLDELTQLLRIMLPPLHLAAQDERMLMALVPEGAELDAVLERFTASPKMPPMALEGLQKWAGENVQVMGQVELRSLLREVMEAFSSLDPDGPMEIPEGEPVRIRYASEVGELRHAARMQTRTGALFRFIAEMEELDD